jgi:L-fuconolactonase
LEIIDAQLHDIGPNLEWKRIDQDTRHGILTELILAWMDAVGVDRTIVHPRDEAWAKVAIAENPHRFAGVYRVRDAEAFDVVEQVAASKNLPGCVGLRLTFGKREADPTGEIGSAKVRAGAFDRFFSACEKLDMPLFCVAFGHVHLVGEIAAAHPCLKLIVDHMGIAQPPLNPRESPRWKGLPGLLQIGKYENVAVKLCGVPVLSDQAYPFSDVWPHMHDVLNVFGAGRIMWASDIGRFTGRISWDNQYSVAHPYYPGKHNYAEALFFLLATDQLSLVEKELMLGGTVKKLLGWPK